MSTMAQLAPTIAQSGLLGGQEQPMQAPQFMPQAGTGNQTLTALAQPQNTAQEAEQRKQRRYGLLG
jgi:hypothetical protein